MSLIRRNARIHTDLSRAIWSKTHYSECTYWILPNGNCTRKFRQTMSAECTPNTRVYSVLPYRIRVTRSIWRVHGVNFDANIGAYILSIYLKKYLKTLSRTFSIRLLRDNLSDHLAEDTGSRGVFFPFLSRAVHRIMACFFIVVMRLRFVGRTKREA